MKTNLKLVAGGLAGLLTAIGLMAGLLIWAGGVDSSSHQLGEAPKLPPVPAPSMEAELATVTPPSPAVVEPTIEEPPAPPEPSYEPELSDGPIRLRRLIVATGVRGHEPTGATNEIEVGAQRRVYAFVDAVNETDEEIPLSVTFEPAVGESTGHVSLDIPAQAPRWRTWAWTRHIYEPGGWEVVVRAPDGRVIGRRPFVVVD